MKYDYYFSLMKKCLSFVNIFKIIIILDFVRTRFHSFEQLLLHNLSKMTSDKRVEEIIAVISTTILKLEYPSHVQKVYVLFKTKETKDSKNIRRETRIQLSLHAKTHRDLLRKPYNNYSHHNNMHNPTEYNSRNYYINKVNRKYPVASNGGPFPQNSISRETEDSNKDLILPHLLMWKL